MRQVEGQNAKIVVANHQSGHLHRTSTHTHTLISATIILISLANCVQTLTQLMSSEYVYFLTTLTWLMSNE